MPTTTHRNPFLHFQARWVALWGLVILAGCVLASVLLHRVFVSLLPVDALLSPMLLLFFYVAFGAWLLRFLERRSIALPALLGPIPRQWGWPKLALLVLTLLLCSLGSFLLWFGLRYWMFPEAMTGGLPTDAAAVAAAEGLNSKGPWLAQLLKFVVLVLVAPIVEETLFRGIILQRWAVLWGIRPAILLSSLVFGSCHSSNPLGFTVFGLVMALLYVRTRSLLIPIVCHMLNNALAEVMLALTSGRALAAADAMAAASQSLWQGLLLLAIALPFLVMFIRQTWPKASAKIPYQVNLQMGLDGPMGRPSLARLRR